MNSPRAQHSPAASTGAEGRHVVPWWTTKRKVFVLVLVVVVLPSIWFCVRAALVATDLLAAQSLVDKMSDQAAKLDVSALSSSTKELNEHTAGALSGTHDPTWRVAEFIPFLGNNLTAIRVVAESIDGIVGTVAVPGVEMLSKLPLGDETAGAEAASLAALKDAPAIVDAAQISLDSSLPDLRELDTTAVFPQISDVVAQITEVLSTADTELDTAAPLVKVGVAALGFDGPRNYLLAFQNNAESTALGGSAASYTVIHTDSGSISTVDQGNSGDFEPYSPDGLVVDQSAIDIFGPFLTNRLNTSTSRPDFPTAANIMRAFWLRDKGAAVDGVLSVDPIALAQVLKATGPVTLSSGDVVSSDNAVDLLTNGIYLRYPSYSESDKASADLFFAETAYSIIEKLTSGSFDIKAMMTSLTHSIDRGSVMFWSADPEEQTATDGTRIQGVLPTTNAEETVIGIYYRDTSASKIDYYLETQTETSTNTCTTDGNPTFTSTVTLRSNLTAAQARALPAYVKSATWGAAKFRTEVFVYGPIGASVNNATVVAEGLDTTITGTTAVDLGRPVASFGAYLAPGETTTVTVTFAGVAGDYGPLHVRGTPMINTTETTITPSAACG